DRSSADDDGGAHGQPARARSVVRPSYSPARSVGEEDYPLRGSAPDGGCGLLQRAEQQRDAPDQFDLRGKRAGMALANLVHEPACRAPECGVRLVSACRASSSRLLTKIRGATAGVRYSAVCGDAA